MKDRAFVIAAIGDRRKNIQRLVKNIRHYYNDIPIEIITTKDSNIGSYKNYDNPYMVQSNLHFVERIWPKGSYREGVRNSNYYKIKFAMNNHYSSLCLLDDDMFITNKNFIDGFDIAERFGVAVPLNPRVYIKYNAMGTDVQQKDLDEINQTPLYAPSCNFSPFFVYPHHGYTTNFLNRLLSELQFNTCRGTLAIWKASWQTGLTPVYLPEQWCVCGSNAEYIKNYKKVLQGKEIVIEPMMLHLGHKKVREVFGIE